MHEENSRRLFVVIWCLALLGVVLLFWWGFSVYANGIELTEVEREWEVRPVEVMLLAAGCISLFAALFIPILRYRRMRRRRYGRIQW